MIEGALTENEYIASWKLYCRRVDWNLRSYLKNVALMALFLILFIQQIDGFKNTHIFLTKHFEISHLTFTVLFSFFFMALWVPAWTYVSRYSFYYKLRFFYREYEALRAPSKATWDDVGFRLKSEFIDIFSPWSHIKYWAENKDILQLYPARLTMHTLMKRAFESPEELEDLKQRLKDVKKL